MDNFNLPEKWCIDIKTINDKAWFKSQIINPLYNHFDNSYKPYYHFLNLESVDSGRNDPAIGFKLITFEQFKNYLLKNEEFHVGDYVYVDASLRKNRNSPTAIKFNGQVVTVKEIFKESKYFYPFEDVNSGGIWLNEIRKATSEEIKAYKGALNIQDNTYYNFKVGDYIIATNSKNPQARKIIEITNNYFKTESSLSDPSNLGFPKNATDLRLATYEEIMKTINKDFKAFPAEGCMKVTEEQSKILQKKLLSLGYTFGSSKSISIGLFDYSYVSWKNKECYRFANNFCHQNVKEYKFEELFNNNLKQPNNDVQTAFIANNRPEGGQSLGSFRSNGTITSTSRLVGQPPKSRAIKGKIGTSPLKPTVFTC